MSRQNCSLAWDQSTIPQLCSRPEKSWTDILTEAAAKQTDTRHTWGAFAARLHQDMTRVSSCTVPTSKLLRSSMASVPDSRVPLLTACCGSRSSNFPHSYSTLSNFVYWKKIWLQHFPDNNLTDKKLHTEPLPRQL